MIHFNNAAAAAAAAAAATAIVVIAVVHCFLSDETLNYGLTFTACVFVCMCECVNHRINTRNV